MDENWIEQVRLTLNQKSTEELRQIWEENDRQAWSDDAFKAIERILEERGETPGPQAQPAPPDESVQITARERPGCVTAYALLTAIGAVLYALGSSFLAIASGMDDASILAIVTLLLLTGIIIAVAVGLWRLNNWARIATIVLQSLNLMISIMLAIGGAIVIPSLIGIVVGGYTIYWFAVNGRFFVKQPAI